MKKPRRSRFVWKQGDTHVVKKHRCKWQRDQCRIGICCSGTGCCIMIFTIPVLLILLLSHHPCSEDIDCETSNPCSIDTCIKGLCQYEKKKDCCVKDSDCGNAPCYSSYCDRFSHDCRALPSSNGTQCIDSDTCTIDDRCYNGECIGKTLSCHNTNECIQGSCMEGQGCIFQNNADGISCDDNNPCTLNDECYNGMCAVSTPKDCTHLDGICSIGACDVVTGDCVRFARNEGHECDDGKQCTTHDKCTNGICAGQENLCFDNNPCTINTCSEQSGCIVQYETESGQCIPGCTKDEECPLSYICYDGTCIKTPNAKAQHIAMIGYEIEECTNSTYSKLIQHFVLDTTRVVMNGETRYRIIKDPSDILTNPAFAPLGFGDQIINLAYNHFGNGIARTTFSIATECQTFTSENCKFQFANREYRFFAYTHDCIDIGGLAYGCIKMNHVLEASISLSLSTCKAFNGQVEAAAPYARAVVIYHGLVYKEPWNAISETDEDSYGTVGIETNTIPTFIPVITDMRVCQRKEVHHLGGCVDGTNRTVCYNIGCFGWDPLDSPLAFRWDIIQNSSVTALALSDTFLASGCYDNEQYNNPDKCSLTRCNENGLDDYFKFLFTQFNNKENYVFDITYRISLCNITRRRLLNNGVEGKALAIVNFG